MMMSQHFLLSAAARTLSLSKVMRLSEDEAFETFKAIRWDDNGGEPYCGKCGCTAIYTFKARRIFKCKGCNAQFSLTSGTIFASRKMSLRDILAAIAIFTNGAKGHSALQLSRDLDCQYKTAFVLTHKLREAMATPSVLEWQPLPIPRRGLGRGDLLALGRAGKSSSSPRKYRRAWPATR
jgi:transposase-like protein